MHMGSFGKSAVYWVLGLVVALGVQCRATGQSSGTTPGAGPGQQSGAVAVPKFVGPPVAEPPEYTHFLIRYEPVVLKAAKGEKGPPPRYLFVKSLEYLKGPKVGRLITTHGRGTSKLMWWYGDIAMERFSDSPYILFTGVPRPAGKRRTTGDYAMDAVWLTKYPGFEWVRPEHFVGEEVRNGLPCYRFAMGGRTVRTRLQSDADAVGEGSGVAVARQVAAGMPTNGAVQAVVEELEVTEEIPSNEAWVTVDGRWPVAFREGDVMGIYQHMEAPRPGAFPRMDPAMEKDLTEYLRSWGLPDPKY